MNGIPEERSLKICSSHSVEQLELTVNNDRALLKAQGLPMQWILMSTTTTTTSSQLPSSNITATATATITSISVNYFLP